MLTRVGRLHLVEEWVGSFLVGERLGRSHFVEDLISKWFECDY